MKKYGYARVSSRSQNEARQIEQLQNLEEELDDIFIDKVSGSSFARPDYLRMVHSLRRGDIVYVCSLDRLGRNYSDMIYEWKRITKEIGADIVVLDMPLLDTRMKMSSSSLTDIFVSDVVLQVLSYLYAKCHLNRGKD